jgi:hypothetical protein
VQTALVEALVVCNECREAKWPDEFYRDKGKKNGLTGLCKECTKARSLRHYHEVLTPEQKRAQYLKRMDKVLLRKYGLPIGGYDELLRKQGGRCGICRAAENRYPDDRFDVDHDHETGKVRGLLCNRCNRGIAWLGDSVEGVRTALAYLESRDA